VTEFLDESTLGLLFGMMILVGKLKDTGLFEVLCAATLKASRGKMWLLSLLMMYITGALQQQQQLGHGLLLNCCPKWWRGCVLSADGQRQQHDEDRVVLCMCLFAAAAGVSAFFDNVTTLPLMGAITISMVKTVH
jgi:Na+/H+ antiporter NhaD/arsenite permease-like protein